MTIRYKIGYFWALSTGRSQNFKVLNNRKEQRNGIIHKGRSDFGRRARILDRHPAQKAPSINDEFFSDALYEKSLKPCECF